MQAFDLIAAYWNDALTLLTGLAVFVIGYYQVQHYRSQSPNLSIFEVSTATHRAATGSGGYTDEGGYREETEYIVEMRVKNDGREPTSISKATLLVDGSDEELDLERYKGSLEVPISGQGSFDPPRSVDKRLRIAGQDVVEVEYRTKGESLDDRWQAVEGIVRLQSVSGKATERAVTFVDWEA